ncbi:MAG: DinB family protein [Janthinobacterium lividum]
MSEMPAEQQVEPWLRGTHTDLDPVWRAVLHALEQAREDVLRWCGPLDAEALELEALGLPSPAFQMRHIARSLDRLMTYAEGNPLTDAQLAALHGERLPTAEVVFEFEQGMDRAIARLLTFDPARFNQARGVGRAMLPTTVAGLLIHIAEHTQRHVGQAITTAKVVAALRESQRS